MAKITSRDRDYIKTIYLLGGEDEPTSPSELANKMGVSKVGALEKMRRLEDLGFGKYVARKGILLNKKSINLIEEAAKRHHLVEKFLQDSLGIKHPEACKESSKIALELSDETIEEISTIVKPGSTCSCGFNIGKEVELEKLRNCPWLRNEQSI